MNEYPIKENNLHKQLHHIIALLISILVIQTHSAVVFIYCDQDIESCCYSAAHYMCSHAVFLHTLGTRLHVSRSHSGQQATHIHSFLQFQFILPLSSTSKSLTIHSNLTLHICYTDYYVSHIRGSCYTINELLHSGRYNSVSTCVW